jgi:quercetin dioxygenase-like cupin family protein
VDHPPPGWSLPIHRHEHESETINVIEGRFEVVVTDARRVLEPDDVAHVPRGVDHSGAALGDGHGRRVLVFAPEGMERVFFETGSVDPATGFDAERIYMLAKQYGWRFAPHPS